MVPGYTTPEQFSETCARVVRDARWVVVDRTWSDPRKLHALFPALSDPDPRRSAPSKPPSRRPSTRSSIGRPRSRCDDGVPPSRIRCVREPRRPPVEPELSRSLSAMSRWLGVSPSSEGVWKRRPVARRPPTSRAGARAASPPTHSSRPAPPRPSNSGAKPPAIRLRWPQRDSNPCLLSATRFRVPVGEDTGSRPSPIAIFSLVALKQIRDEPDAHTPLKETPKRRPQGDRVSEK
jgi:hypothetical protein